MNNAYFESLFELGIENNNLDSIFASFSSFIDLLIEDVNFKNFLLSPVLETEDKIQVIEKLHGHLNKEFLYFIEVILKYDAIKDIEDIYLDFKDKYFKYTNKLEVLILTSEHLGEDKLLKIRALLDKNYPDKELYIKEKIDSSLVQGLKIYVDNKSIGSSIKEELENLKKEILVDGKY